MSVRKRNGKRTHASRTAQLEAKIEDLVTLLRHQTAAADSLSSPGASVRGAAGTSTHSTHSSASQAQDGSPRPGAPAVLPPPQPDCVPGRLPPAPVSRGSLAGAVFDQPVTVPPPFPPESAAMPSCVYQPTPFEAAENMATFRKSMLIFLPFFYFPPAMTSEVLRETHPFLWFSIMTVTCKNVDRRLAMSEAVKKFVAHKMIVEHEKSVDLLLGLLVFMGWSVEKAPPPSLAWSLPSLAGVLFTPNRTHYHIKKEKPMLSAMASLAKSLVFDLGLNKIPSEPYISACLKRSFHPPPREKTLEERRAVLACFYLTSQYVVTSLPCRDCDGWLICSLGSHIRSRGWMPLVGLRTWKTVSRHSLSSASGRATTCLWLRSKSSW